MPQWSPAHLVLFLSLTENIASTSNYWVPDLTKPFTNTSSYSQNFHNKLITILQVKKHVQNGLKFGQSHGNNKGTARNWIYFYLHTSGYMYQSVATLTL